MVIKCAIISHKLSASSTVNCCNPTVCFKNFGIPSNCKSFCSLNVLKTELIFDIVGFATLDASLNVFSDSPNF